MNSYKNRILVLTLLIIVAFLFSCTNCSKNDNRKKEFKVEVVFRYNKKDTLYVKSVYEPFFIVKNGTGRLMVDWDVYANEVVMIKILE